MFPIKRITWLFSCPDITNTISIPGRKGDENHVMYTTVSRAGSQANGLTHLHEKL